MTTPFPGMDPWLENPAGWLDVHNSLITSIRDELAPRVRPKYFVRIEERSYTVQDDDLALVGVPDATVATRREPPRGSAAAAMPGAIVVEVPMPGPIRETYLEVHSVADGRVVAALEILSPWNKRAGEGRDLYESKRRRVLLSLTHLVEIDLLRAGVRPALRGPDPGSDYRILVSRSEHRPRASLLPFGVRDPIPVLAMPLDAGEAEPALDVGSVLHRLYDRAGYDLVTDYGRDPVPPLGPPDDAWADALLRASGLRT